MPFSIFQPDAKDDITEARIRIDFAHHEVHEGDAFIVSAVNTSMGSSDTLVLAFKTPAGSKWVHVVTSFVSIGKATLEIIRAPTWTNQTGSLAPIRNRNHNYPDTASALLEDQAQVAFVASGNLIQDPTGLAGGTVIPESVSFAGRTQGGDRDRSIAEHILEADTQYAVMLTANEAVNGGCITLDWYEHTNS